MGNSEIVGALGDLVGRWNALAEEDSDSRPSGELSGNIAVAYGQSMAFGTAAQELSDLLERLTGALSGKAANMSDDPYAAAIDHDRRQLSAMAEWLPISHDIGYSAYRRACHLSRQIIKLATASKS